MIRPIDNYFLQQPEPERSCLQFLRQYILQSDNHITEEWIYGMPFYCYKGKMCCYLWMHKKFGQPYIGIVEGARINHPDLLQEKRAKMKVMLIDPTIDLPIGEIDEILKAVLKLYS